MPAELKQVGRYRLVEEIGRGAMGAVYRAHDPQLERTVAIKMITAALSAGPAGAAEAEARFLREARVAARLQHPNVVAVYDAGRQGSDLFLVMELVEGEPLSVRLARGAPPPPTAALEIAAQAAEALAAAHAAGIVHRDVKPGNVLLSREGRVKVSDFGVAKALDEATELTRTGMLVGSPAYMSPEQIKGQPIDGRSDLFSLGVVLYEMLIGRKPFPADTVTSLVYQILHEDPLGEPRMLASLGPDYADLLRTCLAKDPAQRFQDGRAFAARCRAVAARVEAGLGPDQPTTKLAAAGLVAAAGAAAAGASSAPPPPPPAPPVATAPLAAASSTALLGLPRRAWWGVAAGAVVLVGLAVGLLVSRRPSPPPALGERLAALPPATATGEPPAVPTPVGTPFSLQAPPVESPTPAPPTPTAATRPVATATPAAAPPVLTPVPTPPPEPRPSFSARFDCRAKAEFHVSPEEALVEIDGDLIGTADDWDDAGGGKPWIFPSPGRYAVKLSLAGFETAWVLLAADPLAKRETCDVDVELREID